MTTKQAKWVKDFRNEFPTTSGMIHVMQDDLEFFISKVEKEAREEERDIVFKALNMEKYTIKDSVPVWVIVDVFRKLKEKSK